MATDILRKGKYAITSEWQTLAAGDVHTVIVTGEYGAGLLIEAKVGAGDDDAQEIGSVSASGQAMKQLVGPLTYRVRRHESIVDTGCSVDGDGAVPQPTPPANTVAPAITGNAQVGQTLTASTGTWSGTTPITYSYQWLRAGSVISGATANTYVVVDDDADQTLTCRVTATNKAGGALVVTAATASVTKAPVNTALPTITGTPTAGQTLTSTTGTWSGAPTPTYTRRWLRNGSAIASATAETYELVAADVGAKITVEVTATNTAGNAVAVSAETETIAGVAPVNTVAPSFTGDLVAEQVQTGSAGTWTGIPEPVYTYQWQTSADGEEWADIAGAASLNYTATESDIGQRLRLEVTATNVAGAMTVNSLPRGPIAGVAPENEELPEVTGTAVVGQELSVSDGTWLGIPEPVYTYQWQTSADGEEWTDIDDAIDVAYTISDDDEGLLIRAVVTATNSIGAAVAEAESVGPIAGIAPANTALPVVSGSVVIGQELSVSNGTWTGTPAPTYTYQWQSSADGLVWTDIAGETAATYTIAAEMDGLQIRAVVTGTNSTSAVAANAAGVGPVAAE